MSWQTELEGYRHTTTVDLRFGDIDMLRHVNNARYLSFLEQARIQYAFDVLGWDGDWRTLNMILARTEIDFLRPLLLGERLQIATRCAQMGKKSFTFEYLLYTAGRQYPSAAPQEAEHLVSRAKSVMVFYDTRKEETRPLPEDFIRRVNAYEPSLSE